MSFFILNYENGVLLCLQSRKSQYLSEIVAMSMQYSNVENIHKLRSNVTLSNVADIHHKRDAVPQIRNERL